MESVISPCSETSQDAPGQGIIRGMGESQQLVEGTPSGFLRQPETAHQGV